MKASQNMWQKAFSHIYIENEAYRYELTARITSMFKDSVIIDIKHYKDIFCRHGQSFVSQKNCPKLILAVRRDAFFYKGSEMCDSFGNTNFYYSSHVMNCLYDCEYCYLQGMYDSANVVIFVNIEDYFNNLPADPYICVSYDSDLLSFEHMTGFVRKWLEVCWQGRATAEIRTKSASFSRISDIESTDNAIFSWTLSPDEIISRFEHKTPPLKARLDNIREAADKGWKVRICVDPVICVDGFIDMYSRLAKTISESVDTKSLLETSIGLYRVPKKYSKKILDIRSSEASVYEFDGYVYNAVLSDVCDVFIRHNIQCRMF